jgi:hypothetical protein
MTVLGSAYYNGHMIVVEMSAMGRVKVLYDGREMYNKLRAAGMGTYVFSVLENGQNAYYEAEIGFGWRKAKFLLKRNGVLVFSNEKGFSPREPVQTQPQNNVQNREIVKEIVVKEVVLVVCPSCNHRNDSTRRICEKCGASI